MNDFEKSSADSELTSANLELNSVVLRTSTSKVLGKIFNTTLGTALGTSALVGVHHHYRKQQQPDAHLRDYLTGIRSQYASFRRASTFARVQHSYQQAVTAFNNYSQDNVNKDASFNDDSNLLTLHTTTTLTRPVCWISGVSSMPKPSNHLNNDNTLDRNSDERCTGVVGIDADRKLVWQTTMPERVHDIVVQPKASNSIDNSSSNAPENLARDVVVMGRRPSESFWVLETSTGQVKLVIEADPNRHFYGHACYSLDGTQLYVTQNDTISLQGKIGIYDALNDYKKITEFDSHGIGPHELIMHPDGETLVVANGGIKTEQASREELNLETMRPSLVYLNRHNGALMEQVTPEHNQMSIRHLAMHDDGTVMIGIQFQGARHINVPLVLTHKRGDAEFSALTMPNNQWQRFHQYIASVAVDSQNNRLCVTTPIGGCAAIYDLTTRELIGDVKLQDCAGASVIVENSIDDNDKSSGFIISDGKGQLTALHVNSLASAIENKPIIQDSVRHNMAFDNHLQML